MEKPLASAAVFAALQRVDLRRWGAKATVVCYVAELTAARDPGDWARGSRDYVRAHTGLAESTVQTALDALVADRVLERHPGAGSRGHAYRIQPNLRLWRRVPWRRGTDPLALAYAVEVVNGELRYTGPPRVVDRSMSGQQIRIAARSLAGQPADGRCAIQDRSSNGGSLTGLTPVSDGNGSARCLSGQQIRPPGAALPSSLDDDDDEKELARLIDAIQSATGAPVWGALVDRIAGVLRRGLALEDALAHVRAAGSRWTPPQLVGQLEARARGLPPLAPPAPEPTAPPPDAAPAAFVPPERDVIAAPPPADFRARFALHANGQEAD